MIPLYLHIGNHKTGSTAIQNFMYQNREGLIRKGILYPDIGIDGAAHHSIAWACGQGKHVLDEAFLAFACKTIAAIANKNSSACVVLSSEEFEYIQDLGPLEIFKEYFEVRVILYVRKQDHYLESMYGQHVSMYQTRYSGSIYQFIPRINFFVRFNYNALANRWAQMFGDEKVIVRPYGTSLIESDVRKDILNIVDPGIEIVTEDFLDNRKDNASLPAEALSYLSYINQMRITHVQHQRLIYLMREIVPARRDIRLLEKEDARMFYEHFNASNTLFFSKYMGKESVPFDSLAEGDMRKGWFNHEKVEIRTLLEILDRVVCGEDTNP